MEEERPYGGGPVRTCRCRCCGVGSKQSCDVSNPTSSTSCCSTHLSPSRPSRGSAAEARVLTHMYGEGIRQGRHGRLRAPRPMGGTALRSGLAISKSVEEFLVRDHAYPASRWSASRRAGRASRGLGAAGPTLRRSSALPTCPDLREQMGAAGRETSEPLRRKTRSPAMFRPLNAFFPSMALLQRTEGLTRDPPDRRRFPRSPYRLWHLGLALRPGARTRVDRLRLCTWEGRIR